MRGNLPAGTVVKGYRIEKVLSAAGNFAAVYLAFDTDAARVARRRDKVSGRLGRWAERYGPAAAQTQIDPGPYVALKEYAPRDLSWRDGQNVVALPDKVRVFEWGRERFKRESEFLAEHSHPNVVAVFDHFHAFSTEYYVMERLSGGSLGELIEKQGIQAETQVRRWLMPVLEGLASVERRDANHLDLSPGNIIFRRPGGEPVLVDFGAGRIPGAALGHSTRFVVDEHFAAPEKFTHGSRNLDSRSDVYSLSAVANFALTGEMPPPATARAAGGLDMSVDAARRRAERASPPFLRAIDRGFAVQAGSRFPHAMAFGEALRTVQDVTVAGPAWRGDATLLKLLILGALACFLLLLIIIIGIYML